MQTFLPYPNFTLSAMALDYRRLGKQRVEARQIQKAIQEGPGAGWYNHPARLMWEGYTEALMLYGDCCIREWVRRGYNNTMPLMISAEYDQIISYTSEIEMPPWLGREDFHSAHRSILLAKDYEHYSQHGWDEKPGAECIWPVTGVTV